MTIAASIGKSTTRNSREAGVAAARAAIGQLAGAPTGVLVFGTAGYDQVQLLQGIREVTGSTPLLGCSGEGVITQNVGSDESTHAVAVMALAGVPLHTFHSHKVSDDPHRAGQALAAAVAEIDYGPNDLLIVLADGLTANCNQLLMSLREQLPRPLQIAGGTAGDTLKFTQTYQYCDDQVMSDGVCAALLRGGAWEIEVSHGCEMVGLEHRVTRAEGGIVMEVDGRPAWDVLREVLEEDGKERLEGLDVSQLCFGVQLERPDTSGYGDHVIRVPVRLDSEAGHLFFAGELPVGAQIQLARRDASRVCETALASAQRIRQRRAGQAPSLVLQFDCTGRGRLLFGNKSNEELMKPLQQVFGETIPWLGFHSYGEIAPLGGEATFHNLTVVLCAMYPS
jgi:hypothetical protein